MLGIPRRTTFEKISNRIRLDGYICTYIHPSPTQYTRMHTRIVLGSPIWLAVQGRKVIKGTITYLGSAFRSFCHPGGLSASEITEIKQIGKPRYHLHFPDTGHAGSWRTYTSAAEITHLKVNTRHL